jgi:hypothetical protein
MKGKYSGIASISFPPILKTWAPAESAYASRHPAIRYMRPIRISRYLTYFSGRMSLLSVALHDNFMYT